MNERFRQRKKKTEIYQSSPICQPLDQERLGKEGETEEQCRWVWWVPLAFCCYRKDRGGAPLELGVTPEGKAGSIVYEPSLFHRCPKLDSLSVPLSYFWHPSTMIPGWLFWCLSPNHFSSGQLCSQKPSPYVPFLLTLSHPALDHYLSKAKKMPQLQVFIAPVWGDDWPLGGFVVWKAGL